MKEKKKRDENGKGNRIAVIIIGAILVLGLLLPVASNLFGRTGYITEITRFERIGGKLDEPGYSNAYWWSVGYNSRRKTASCRSKVRR